MFNRKRNKAISLINIQIEKLNSLGEFDVKAWKNYTSEMLMVYFRPNSPFVEDIINEKSIQEEYGKKRVKALLSSARDHIINHGVYIAPVNIFGVMPRKEAVAIISGILLVVGGICFEGGRTIENMKIDGQKAMLKDSLIIYKRELFFLRKSTNIPNTKSINKSQNSRKK